LQNLDVIGAVLRKGDLKTAKEREENGDHRESAEAILQLETWHG
jgi:hypothetical protein